MKRPGFFIVGAPKCGTTAMNKYLAQHPGVFMAKKELHFFGSDLKTREKLSEPDYLNHFQHAGEGTLTGEASVWYLFSKTAAKEIKEFSPGAKIIIMLRDPVEMLYSLHSEHLFNANEDTRDFEKALELDGERSKGKNQPRSNDFIELPLYREAGLFSEQVKRYIDIFGMENVHIILYEDFKRDVKKTVAGTLEFLGLKVANDLKLDVVNPNKKINFFALHRLLKHPPARLKKLARIFMPAKTIRHQLMKLIFKLNSREAKRKKMNERLNNELRHFFSDDIKKLSVIINRDLSGWVDGIK